MRLHRFLGLLKRIANVFNESGPLILLDLDLPAYKGIEVVVLVLLSLRAYNAIDILSGCIWTGAVNANEHDPVSPAATDIHLLLFRQHIGARLYKDYKENAH